jgi:hypothetical protein
MTARRTLTGLTGMIALLGAGLAHGQAVPTPPTITGTVRAATITSTSTLVLTSPGGRTLLAVDNESTTATIACAFGNPATAAINTAGSFTMTPGQTRTWLNFALPTEPMYCISSAATSPATIEVF